MSVQDLINRQGPMTDLTKTVRPFVGPGGQPTRKRSEQGLYFGTPTYVPPGTTTEGEAAPAGTLRWSAQQPVQTTTLEALGFDIDWGDDANDIFSELDRTFHIERVFNPDDDSQFVDLQVVDSITYKNQKNAQFSYSFNNSDDS